MPRNPDKTRCTVPGCHNWAMLGHTRCRSHRDHELGARGVGAPAGNLNALRTGEYVQPLSGSNLESLVAAAIDGPEDLAFQVGLAVQSLQDRAGDAFRTLLALRALVSSLVNDVAERLFTAELEAVLGPLPQPARDQLQAAIERVAARQRPVTRLATIRRIKKRRNKPT